MRVRQTSLVIILGIALGGSISTSYAKQKQPVLNNAPIVVQASPIQFGNVPIYIDALGSLTAEESVTISSEVDGRISHIYFANGQQVGKNMPIVKFNNSVEQANYNIAVSDLNLARSTLRRLKLLPPGVESKQDLSVKQAAIDSDEAKVQLAQANLNQKTLTAPFDGYLNNFTFQVGDYVTAGTPIVTLDNNNTILVNFSAQQSLSDKLKNGQQIKFTADAFPKKTFYGTVTYISPTVDPATRTIAVQALFANKKNLLSPGMFVHAQQQIGMTKHAMLIPDSAIGADVFVEAPLLSSHLQFFARQR